MDAVGEDSRRLSLPKTNREAPNSKLQSPRKFQVQYSKSKTRGEPLRPWQVGFSRAWRLYSVLNFGPLNLRFPWDLVLGIWNFSACRRAHQ
jgi:hypothetical protein